MKQKHVVIIDQIGRILLGVEVGQDESTLTLNNPIILHFQPAQNGQLELQVYPLFFFELLDKAKRTQNNWTFNKSSITTSDVEVTPDILARYQQINTPPPSVKNNPKVISIDDL